MFPGKVLGKVDTRTDNTRDADHGRLWQYISDVSSHAFLRRFLDLDNASELVFVVTD
jgi:hypothetical protein